MMLLLHMLRVCWADDLAALAVEMREAHDDARYITAGRLASEVLAADPTHLEGLFVMGRVQWLSEGNHARAMHYLKEGDRLYTDELSLLEERPWRVHSEILFALQNVAEEVGDYGYQLTLMERYDELYNPPFGTAERAWAYMREDDMANARASAMSGIQDDDVWQQVLGHNSLCAIEAAVGNRELGLIACQNALEHRREYGEGSLAIAAGNASGAAASALDFALAEKWLKEAVRGGATASTWRRLVVLYLNQGRAVDAVEALTSLRGVQALMEPSMRDLRRADIDVAFAQLLLVAGETDKGLTVINRALQYPDRRGLISTDEQQARGGHSLVRRAMRVTHRERLREQNAAKGVLARWLGAIRLWLPQPNLWADEAAVRGALTDSERLMGTLGFYLDNGLNEAQSWLVGDVVDIIGAGVTAAALTTIRSRETFPGMEAYYTGLDAEIALQRGQYQQARTLAETALQGMPQAETLARARLHGVAALAAEKKWDADGAMEHYGRLMQLDPGTARRLRLCLPAQVSSSGDRLAGRVARALSRSPRFRRDSDGFQVVVEVLGDQYSACLRSPTGDQLGCAEGQRPQTEEDGPFNDADFVMHMVTDFHDRVFGMPLGLSAVDLNSLDGTTTVRSEVERQRMEDLLNEL